MRIVKGILDRGLDVLELLAAEGRWLRLSDIAARLELPKGPAHRMLSHLAALGWVEQDDATGRYRLTLKMALLGQQYLHATGLPGLIQPILDDVAKESHELVRLTAVQGTELSWLAFAQGAASGLMYQPAMTGRIDAHTTANGKVWLAAMGNEDAVRIALRNGLGKPGRFGPRAIATVDALLVELNAIRARGYATAIEEAEPGVNAIAVAIRSRGSGAMVGTISIAGPLTRVNAKRFDEFHQLLRRAAEKLGTIWPDTETQREEAPAWTASASNA